MVEGIDRSQYNETLTHVPDQINDCPVRSFDMLEVLGPKAREYVERYYETDDVVEVLHDLPAPFFLRMGMDRAAKAMVSKKT